MPNDVEKESRWARRQRKWEEKRQRRNEQRLEGQRREYERQCEALRKKAAAVEEGDAAPRVQNESESGETRVEQWGDKDLEEPQPLREEAAAAASRSDGQRKRPRKPKRGNRRRAEAKAEMNASPVPAKNEHPELHVIAQLTPLAPPSPPLTPSSHSGTGETCRQDEDFRTRMEADYLFDPPLRCAAPAPSLTEPESAQTREAAADVLFLDSELPYVPIVKISRASAAFYRNGVVETGNTRQPQKFSRGRGRGRGFGRYGRGVRAPRGEFSRTNWGY
jgi:hypothetical protein